MKLANDFGDLNLELPLPWICPRSKDSLCDGTKNGCIHAALHEHDKTCDASNRDCPKCIIWDMRNPFLGTKCPRMVDRDGDCDMEIACPGCKKFDPPPENKPDRYEMLKRFVKCQK